MDNTPLTPAQALAQKLLNGRKGTSDFYNESNVEGDSLLLLEESLLNARIKIARSLNWLDSGSDLYGLCYDGLIDYSRTVSVRTFESTCVLLQRGLFAYSDLTGVKCVDQYDRFFWIGYRKWLDGLVNYNKPDASLSVGTKQGLYHAAIKPFKALLGHKLRDSDARRVLDSFPDNQWRGAHLASKPLERLDTQTLIKIWEAAEEEIDLLMHTWELKDKVISLQKEVRAKYDVSELRNIGFALLYFSTKYPNSVPVNKRLKITDPQVYRYVYRSNDSENIGLGRIVDYLYPGSRRLAPFVVQLAIESALNPESLLRLSFSDIQIKSVFGVDQLYIEGSELEVDQALDDEMIDVSPPKPRSTVPPHANLSLEIWKPRFDFLSKYTLNSREQLPDKYEDRVFSFFSGDGSPALFIYDEAGRSFTYSLNSFISDHGLEKFTLVNIRKTVLDEELRQSGDLLAVSRKAGHRSTETMLNHYTSDGTKKWYREKLAEMVLLRERWINTSGVIDPRKRQRASTLDVSSATPGFLCLDPLNSPRSGQRLNKLCQAYGECPSCPLAVANVEDTISVAYYLALLKSIMDARGTMSSKAWQATWSEVAADLLDLLDLVADVIKDKASEINIKLPKVG